MLRKSSIIYQTHVIDGFDEHMSKNRISFATNEESNFGVFVYTTKGQAMTVICSQLRCFVIITCFLMLCTFGNVQAFDGKHEGFFFGIGIEPGTSFDRIVYGDGDSYLYGRPAFTLNYKIGYGPSEQLLIYFTGRFSLNGLFNYDFDEEGFHSNSDIFNEATTGIGFMVFPDPGNKFYLSGCLGLATSLYLNEPDIENLLIGIGLSGGIGYKISRNWAINAMLDYRKFNEGSQGEFWNYEDYVSSFTLDVVTLSFAFDYLFY